MGNEYKAKINPGHTICNQLGLYVTFYSPLQMAAERFLDFALSLRGR